MLLSTLGFLGCAVLILYCGKNLSHYGKSIALGLGWAEGWVGLILMASVTSLPELMVGIGSVSIVESADLALGDVLGSCAFNLGVLSLLDVLVRKQTLLSSVSETHALTGTMSIILIALVGVGMYIQWDIVITQWLGFTSILFIAIYVFSIRLYYRYEFKRHPQAAVTGKSADINLKRSLILYAINAAIVVAAALFLPQFAHTIAIYTGLGQSFVGTLFLAASTSLPEIAVSVAAVRMGSLDLATGNLLGSNLFNIFVLAIDDIFYLKGYILKDASDDHLISVLFVIIMTAIAIAGLIYRVERKRFVLAWDTLLIFIAYLLNMVILYNLSIK